MADFIWFSSNDPWWVTISLLTARTIEVLVISTWVIHMIRQAPRHEWFGWPWSYSWPRTLTSWLIALILVITVNVFRVLLVGHIRAQDTIGQWFRIIEVVAAIYLMIWSLMAYAKWRNPKPTNDEGVDYTRSLP